MAQVCHRRSREGMQPHAADREHSRLGDRVRRPARQGRIRAAQERDRPRRGPLAARPHRRGLRDRPPPSSLSPSPSSSPAAMPARSPRRFSPTCWACPVRMSRLHWKSTPTSPTAFPRGLSAPFPRTTERSSSTPTASKSSNPASRRPVPLPSPEVHRHAPDGTPEQVHPRHHPHNPPDPASWPEPHRSRPGSRYRPLHPHGMAPPRPCRRARVPPLPNPRREAIAKARQEQIDRRHAAWRASLSPRMRAYLDSLTTARDG